MRADPKELLITHYFNASPEEVFQAWTDPEQLKLWYAPDGCSIEFRTIEVKEGGHFHSCIHDPVHGNCWIRGTYREVLSPRRLVFTMQLSDENGRTASPSEAGKPESWPAEILTTVVFEPAGGQTRATIHQTVAEEEAKKTGAYQSWIRMFSKLGHQLNQTK